MMKRFGFISLAVIGNLFYILPAYPLPVEEEVVSGEVDFQRPDSQTLNISTSDRVIIHYSSFDIASDEAVHFFQPSSGSVALNRIFDEDPSQILGTLSANGQIFLVNSNGIVFGEGCRVDVAGLVASSLNILDSDFLAKDYHFYQLDSAKAVINDGLIRTEETGYVALVGGGVENRGIIEARLGSVILAAGESTILSFGKEGLVSIVLDKPLEELGACAINNTGRITADGGKVILASSSLPQIFNQVVNNEGIIEAGSLVGHNGTIELLAEGENSSIVNKGILDVSSKEESVNGGSISICADYIYNQGKISANAHNYSQAGGVYLVADKELHLEDTSLIETKGKDEQSQGGYVYLYSYGDAYAEAKQTIDLSGGRVSGDAGSGELSSRSNLSAGGSIQGSAEPGYKRGRFIFDPAGDNTIDTNQIVTADTTWFATNDLIVSKNASVTANNGANLFFLADHQSSTLQNWHNGTGDFKQKSGGTGLITTNGGGDIVFAGKTISLKNSGVNSSGDINFYYNIANERVNQNDFEDSLINYVGMLNIYSTGKLSLNSDFDSPTLFNGGRGLGLESDSNNGGEVGDIVDLNSKNIDLLNGDMIINSRGTDDFILTDISCGTGNIQIDVGGSILDDGTNATKITAADLTLSSGGAIGTDTPTAQIDSSVDSVSLTANNGGIYLENDKGLTVNLASSTNGSIALITSGNTTLTNLTATGTGTNNISLTTTGNISLGTITSDDMISLTSTAGSILDDLVDTTLISADIITLTCFGDIGGPASFSAVDWQANTISATSTGGGSVYLNPPLPQETTTPPVPDTTPTVLDTITTSIITSDTNTLNKITNSNISTVSFNLPSLETVALYQVNSFDILGSTYLYHPLIEVPSFEPEGVEY